MSTYSVRELLFPDTEYLLLFLVLQLINMSEAKKIKRQVDNKMIAIERDWENQQAVNEEMPVRNVAEGNVDVEEMMETDTEIEEILNVPEFSTDELLNYDEVVTEDNLPEEAMDSEQYFNVNFRNLGESNLTVRECITTWSLFFCIHRNALESLLGILVKKCNLELPL